MNSERICEGCGRAFSGRAERKNCSRQCVALVKKRVWAADVEERFWARVDRSGGPDACWPWTGCTLPAGYGKVAAFGRQVLTHRLALQIATGIAPPAGRLVCHRCDMPGCCNPAHLFVGTPQDNSNDMRSKGRARGKRAGQPNGITAERMAAIRAEHAAGATKAGLARRYGVVRNTISRIVEGQTA